jgi:hypothetical protein
MTGAVEEIGIPHDERHRGMANSLFKNVPFAA